MGQRVDYDDIAELYESRYLRNDYSGVEQALAVFVADASVEDQRILEVGCGCGHWLRCLTETNLSTSQLMVISEPEYQAGVRRIHDADAASNGRTLLRSNLRLYGTTGWAA